MWHCQANLVIKIHLPVYLYDMTVFQRDEWNCRFEPDAQLVQNVVSAALVHSGSKVCATKIWKMSHTNSIHALTTT